MMDIRSTNDLQTIPTNKIVVVYDVNGQVSPKIVAYLRLLGYDAKSMLFGANTLFYSRVLWVESLAPLAFKQDIIMNLPYVTGN
jgi:rhodanese-related sulfurtransferase